MRFDKIYTFAILLMINSSWAQAQEGKISWISTAFWTAPQVRQFTPALKADKEESLIKSCLEYRRRIETLTLPAERELVERFRKTDSLSSDGSFLAKFRIDQLEENYHVGRGFVVDHLSEKLPYFTQVEAVTSANIDEKTFYNIHTSSDSYTEFSRSLKLEDSEFSLEYERGVPYIKIYGRDLACDFLTNKISFEITTSAFVRINNETYEKMLQFYLNQIQPDLSSILSHGGSDGQLLKAARLGFRFGNHLQNQNENDSKLIESQIENLMNTLFIPGTLKNSAEVLDSLDGKKKEIQIASMTMGKPVKIYLKYQK